MEYLSRKDRYDGQLAANLGISKEQVAAMRTSEKMGALKAYRMDQYEKLKDAVYMRRGWTQNGIPTPQKMRMLGFTDDIFLEMLQKKIGEDEKAGLNVWGGKYVGGEKPPSPDRRYWDRW
jgi:aldehyde:ferredoxin oxidoreductase